MSITQNDHWSDFSRPMIVEGESCNFAAMYLFYYLAWLIRKIIVSYDLLLVMSTL